MNTQGKRTSIRGRWQGWSWRKRGLVALTGVVLVVLFIAATSILTGRGWRDGVSPSEGATPEPVSEQVRDWDKPTDPKELEAYNFAHSLELPDSLPKTVPFDFGKYSRSDRSTTAKAYFKHLCETEAGDYVFKTIEKVEGLYQMRPREKATQEEFRDLYRMEDPYGGEMETELNLAKQRKLWTVPIIAISVLRKSTGE